MQLKYKIWLYKNGKVFGDGPLEILKRIERDGSLRRAAADINMSYSQAWNLIKNIEDKLGFKLLEKRIGGKKGGGSTLTNDAKQLMDKYEKLKIDADRTLKELYKKHFLDDLF